ncbi:MAG TPA: ATP-binding protein [Myxococcales bacterium]|nr:ATP-binding protein [Myxococcales bacterium]
MASRILIVGCAREGAELERLGHCLAHVADARALPQWLADPEGWDVALLPPDLALLHSLQKVCPRTEVIVLALPGERAAAIRCLREGAFASVRRPCEGGELDELVERALERKALREAEAQLLALRGVLEAREKLPEAIVSAFAEALSAQSACLLVPAPEDGRLTVAYLWGGDGQGASAPSWVHDWLRTEEEPAIVGAASGDQPPQRAARGPGLVHPLTAEGRLVAILTAQRERPPFGPADLERASVLAAQARLALENDRLLQHVASSDRLVSLGQLAASIAHEIRTPLTYVLENAGYIAEHLPRFAPPESAQPTRETVTFTQMRRASADAVDGANRMRDIIRDIGALASADGNTQLPFDLKEAVRASLRMAEAELRGRATVTLRMDGETQVIGSVGRMSQVFVNLFVNAVQAIGTERARDGRIMVVVRREGARVLAEVSDNGPGIPAGMLNRVFEPFFTTKPAGQGTGLGLFLCRNIVRRHGGELRVRSTAQHGTTLVVDLPADPTQPERQRPSETETLAPLSVARPN